MAVFYKNIGLELAGSSKKDLVTAIYKQQQPLGRDRTCCCCFVLL
jgi:hypothetical protein